MNNNNSLQSNIVNIPSVIRLNAVVQRTGLSRSTIYRLMGTGQFPRSFKIGKTASGWLEAEIRSWIDERASSRQPENRDDGSVAA